MEQGFVPAQGWSTACFFTFGNLFQILAFLAIPYPPIRGKSFSIPFLISANPRFISGKGFAFPIPAIPRDDGDDGDDGDLGDSFLIRAHPRQSAVNIIYSLF